MRVALDYGMSALDTWFNKYKRSLSCFLTSDAEVKKIKIFYYAHVSTDIKLTESFDTEILQIPPNLTLSYGRSSR